MDAPPLTYKNLKMILAPTLDEEYHEKFTDIQRRIDRYFQYSVLDIYKQYFAIAKFTRDQDYSMRLQLFREQQFELKKTIQRILHVYPNHQPDFVLSAHKPQLKHKHRSIVRSLKKILRKSKVKLKQGKREFLHMAWKKLGAICRFYDLGSKERKFLINLRQRCAQRLYKELFCP